eukprot:XP_011678468.1 PREDICTED: high affinity cationic amino acid transporter 1 [Strongylocentrotus purpuratus]
MSRLRQISHALMRKKQINKDPTAAAASRLRRCLSVGDLILLGIGNTLGAGIYVITGQVSKWIAGPALVLSFMIAAVAAVLAGMCFAEMGARVPKAGSAYVYTYVTMGEFIGFFVGWNVLIENILVLMGIGVKTSSVFNNMFTGLNLVVISYIIICGFFKIVPSNWSIPMDDLPKIIGIHLHNTVVFIFNTVIYKAIFLILYGCMFALPRFLYSMAEDGMLFKFLGEVHSHFQTPLYACLTSGIIAGMITLVIDLQSLVNVVVMGAMVPFLTVAACVIILRKEPDMSAPASSSTFLFPQIDGYQAGYADAKRSSVAKFLSQAFRPVYDEPTPLSYRVVIVCVVLFSTP